MKNSKALEYWLSTNGESEVLIPSLILAVFEYYQIQTGWDPVSAPLL